MRIKEKIFIAIGLLWLAIVYVAYYIGLLNGLSRFHPGVIEKIKNFLP